MSLPMALTIPGVDVGVWQVRHRFDKAAATLADRHYSRERIGSPQVGGPGYVLVLVSPCERAVWISKRHSPETKELRVLSDGLNGYRCAMFRNEGAGLSSDLITEAVALTEHLWGPPPRDGWITYVNKSRIASSNPGYCFKAAGWQLDRSFVHPYLVRLLLPAPRPLRDTALSPPHALRGAVSQSEPRHSADRR